MKQLEVIYTSAEFVNLNTSMDLIRNFNPKSYNILKTRFPKWELSFQDTFSLLFDLKNKTVIKARPKIVKFYKKVSYKDYIISGELLYNVIEWYQNERCR